MGPAKSIILATHGTLGDLHPYLAIALELQARGHRPIIASCEYHRRSVESVGIAFHVLRPDLPLGDKVLHRQFTEPKRGMERVIRELMFPVLRATYEDLLAVVQNERADLLISQILIFAAPLVAEKTGIRWISTELQPGAFLSAYDPPVLAPLPALAKLRGLGPKFHSPIFRFAKLKGRSWSEPVRQLRRDLKLPPGKDPLFEGRHSPDLVLALFSRVLGSPQPDWPANTLVTGYPFYDECDANLTPEITKFLSEGEAPIVFTLGSSAVWDAGNFYDESVAVTQILQKRGVLLVGNNPQNQPSTQLPENVISVSYAPYAQIFPRAALIVHQGGVGTTGQALRAGKPMLVMPFGGDQYDNAARVERLGAGRTIMRKRYNAQTVAFELQLLLSDSRYQERAKDLARLVQTENGVNVACDAIERQLKEVP